MDGALELLPLALFFTLESVVEASVATAEAALAVEKQEIAWSENGRGVESEEQVDHAFIDCSGVRRQLDDATRMRTQVVIVLRLALNLL